MIRTILFVVVTIVLSAATAAAQNDPLPAARLTLADVLQFVEETRAKELEAERRAREAGQAPVSTTPPEWLTFPLTGHAWVHLGDRGVAGRVVRGLYAAGFTDSLRRLQVRLNEPSALAAADALLRYQTYLAEGPERLVQDLDAFYADPALRDMEVSEAAWLVLHQMVAENQGR